MVFKDPDYPLFEDRNPMQRQLWAPYYTALQQIVDALAAASLDAQLEHKLMRTPCISFDFANLFQQRHPAVWQEFQAADGARNLAAHAAAKEASKQRGIAKRKQTIARKKAAVELERVQRARRLLTDRL